MKKQGFLLLTVLTVIPLSVSCAASQDHTPTACWQLKTDDTHLTVAVIDNRPIIYELKNSRNGWNWIENFSEMPLPEKVQVGSASYKPDWKYKDTTVEKSDGIKLTLRFLSTTPILELESVWLAKPGVGPVENLVSVKNNSGSSITFEYADVVPADNAFTADSQATLWLFNKAKYLGKNYPSDRPVVKSIKIPANDTISYNLENTGGEGFEIANGNLPFQLLDVDSKHGLYIGYEWNFGRFQNRVDSDPLTIHYRSCLWNTGSVTKENGKVFHVPAMFFGTYMGDIDDGSNHMKRWFWNYKITPAIKNNPDEPEIGYCIPGDEKRLMEFYRQYPIAEWGADYGKIDVDWLDGSGSNWTKGDIQRFAYWRPDPEKWPNGMTASRIVHNNKQKFSLYLPFTFEHADIATQEGRDKQKRELLRRYDNREYDYWRSDFTLEPFYNYLGHEGLLEILDYMYANRPGFRFEHCCGGGLLKDFTSLQRIAVLVTEDTGGSDCFRESFYSGSYMINPVQLRVDIAMNLGPRGEMPGGRDYGEAFNKPGCVNDSPEWVKYVLRTGFMGANFATNWCDYTPNQIEGVKKHWPLYKTKQRPILRGAKVGDVPADVYHILPIPDGVNWDGIEYFNTSLNQGSVFLFKPSKTAPDRKVIKLKGLDRKATYTLTFQDRCDQNTKMTGAELMDKGIEVKGMNGDFAAEIIWIN